MSAPDDVKSGAVQKRMRAKPKIQPAAAPRLTNAQQRVAVLFVALDQETQDHIIRMMEELALQAAGRARPALRLVVGGVQ